jgi:hypothetical protein
MLNFFSFHSIKIHINKVLLKSYCSKTDAKSIHSDGNIQKINKEIYIDFETDIFGKKYKLKGFIKFTLNFINFLKGEEITINLNLSLENRNKLIEIFQTYSWN